MKTSADEHQAIPEIVGIDGWQDVPIEENDEALVLIEALECPKLKAHSTYFHAGVRGAVRDQYVRSSVGKMLVHAAEALPGELALVILDAWRPLEVQQYLHTRAIEKLSAVQSSTLPKRPEYFAAQPVLTLSCPYPHSTGGSVDATLMDESGSHLDMGSIFDDYSPSTATRYYEQEGGDSPASTKFRDRRRVLFHAMAKAGFTNYCREWWHFDFGNQLWAVQRATTARYGRTAPTIFNPVCH